MSRPLGTYQAEIPNRVNPAHGPKGPLNSPIKDADCGFDPFSPEDCKRVNELPVDAEMVLRNNPVLPNALAAQGNQLQQAQAQILLYTAQQITEMFTLLSGVVDRIVTNFPPAEAIWFNTPTNTTIELASIASAGGTWSLISSFTVNEGYDGYTKFIAPYVYPNAMASGVLFQVRINGTPVANSTTAFSDFQMGQQIPYQTRILPKNVVALYAINHSGSTLSVGGYINGWTMPVRRM